MRFGGASILYLKQSLAAQPPPHPTDHLVYSDGLSPLTSFWQDKHKSIAPFVKSSALGTWVQACLLSCIDKSSKAIVYTEWHNNELKSQHKHNMIPWFYSNMLLDHNTNLIPTTSLKYAHHHDIGCPQSLGRNTRVEASWGPLLSSKFMLLIVQFLHSVLGWAIIHFPHGGLADSERHSQLFFILFNSGKFAYTTCSSTHLI